MRSRIVSSLAFVALLLLGCSSRERVLAPQPLDPAKIAGGTFDVIGHDVSGDVVLRGQIHLGPIVGTAIGGTWQLGRWSGSPIAGLPGRGSLRGEVFGRAMMLQLQLPQNAETVGIMVDRTMNGRVTGTISLLPSRRLRGALEVLPAP